MNRKPAILIALLVLLPLAALGWLGMRLAAEERSMIERQFTALIHLELDDADKNMAETLARIAENARGMLRQNDAEPEQATQHFLENGLVSQAFRINTDGDLVFSEEYRRLTPGQQMFFDRAKEHWKAPLQETSAPGKSLAQQVFKDTRNAPADQGWYSWHWEEGIQFVFWWRENDLTRGVQIERMRLIAELVAALPDTTPGDNDRRIALVDTEGNTLYQWGGYTPPENAAPYLRRELPAPFGAWRWEYYAAPGFWAAPGGAVAFGMAAAFAAVALSLLALAVVLYREHTRAVRLAAQRVTFVNQVSHELKTPLTSIRMYAELLENDLPDDPAAQRKLDIIVSESQRLSRLIGNILTFSRNERKTLKLQPQPGRIGESIRNVLDAAGPSLEAHGITVTCDIPDDPAVVFDPDALEQILTNLVSNVEKYAARGGHLDIAYRWRDGVAELRVSDAGPGIAPRDRERIFAPFVRLDNRLSEGASGTGIGLAIVRELARRHGGDAYVDDRDTGACIVVTLEAPVSV